MSDHLGRNPFKSRVSSGEKPQVSSQSPGSIPKPASIRREGQLRDFLFVDLPAGMILLSLKIALLAKAVLFDSNRKTQKRKVNSSV